MAHLREYNLLTKARKYELFLMSIAFLGHIVSEEGITTDPPKSRKDIQLICTQRQGGIRSILRLLSN